MHEHQETHNPLQSLAKPRRCGCCSAKLANASAKTYNIVFHCNILEYTVYYRTLEGARTWRIQQSQRPITFRLWRSLVSADSTLYTGIHTRGPNSENSTRNLYNQDPSHLTVGSGIHFGPKARFRNVVDGTCIILASRVSRDAASFISPSGYVRGSAYP